MPKNKARKLEFKEQPEKAIEAYLEIIKEFEGTPELDDEPGLCCGARSRARRRLQW